MHKKIFSILVFVFLIVGFLHPITAMNQDLGRHMLVGKMVLETGNVPKTNLFSYTYPDFPFINHHWFSEVIFYLVYIFSGYNGLLILTILTICSAFTFIYFYSLKKSNILVVVFISTLFLRILFERTDVRPEIFSFLFLSIFITILYNYREKFTRWIFILPLLELLWVNMHIYFPIGITVIGLFLIDHLVKNRKQFKNHYTSILVFICFASGLLTLLNPNGISGALYPFSVFKNYGYTVEENQTLIFLWNYFNGKETIFYFFLSSTLLFLTLILAFKKTRLIDWLLCITFTILAFNAERNLPLFVLALFIPFANALSNIKIKTLENKKIIKNFLPIFILLFLTWQFFQVTQHQKIGFGVEEEAGRGADFFIKNGLKGPIFNNFDIGSYLEYRLYPKEKIFIDGRPEAYPASFIQNEYIQAQINDLKFQEVSKKYNFNTIFFSYTDQTPWANDFLKRIVFDKNWRIIYLDDYVVILVKNIDNNAKIIKKYGMDANSIKLSNVDFKNEISLIRLSLFFGKTGMNQKVAGIYKKILDIDTNNCFALYNLAVLLAKDNNLASSIYSQKYKQMCL